MRLKSVISVCAAASMLLATATVAFAADSLGQNGSDSAEVKATYLAGESAGAIYSVDISWKGMDFTYTSAGTKWNPETHEYDPNSVAAWTTGEITITNHSNVDIMATPEYTAEENFQNISMNFDNDELRVMTADNGVDGAPGTPVTGKIVVTPQGDLAEGVVDTKIGSIVITIA